MLWHRSQRIEFGMVTAENELYIGAGDSFDDDRRVVRVADATSRVAVHLARRDRLSWLELPVLFDRRAYMRR